MENSPQMTSDGLCEDVPLFYKLLLPQTADSQEAGIRTVTF